MTKRQLKKELAQELAVPLVSQPNGGALLAGGVPGHRGGSGRPTDAFKALCRELASGKRTITEVQAILDDHDHPHFMDALKWATAHGYGRPTGAVEESRITGVIVLGTLEGLDEARRRAHAHRMEDHGIQGWPSPPALGSGGYVPPPGLEAVVIEEDFSVTGSDSAHPAATNGGTKTRAQQIAERRRRMLADTD